MDRNDSDRSESNFEKSDDGPSGAKPTSARKASTSANEQLRRSTCQKNIVMRFRYSEYMAHHYVHDECSRSV